MLSYAEQFQWGSARYVSDTDCKINKLARYQGRVNVPEMMRLLKCSQNTAYRLRKDVLRLYHEQDAFRAEQSGNTEAQEPNPSQQKKEP